MQDTGLPGTPHLPLFPLRALLGGFLSQQALCRPLLWLCLAPTLLTPAFDLRECLRLTWAFTGPGHLSNCIRPAGKDSIALSGQSLEGHHHFDLCPKPICEWISTHFRIGIMINQITCYRSRGRSLMEAQLRLPFLTIQDRRTQQKVDCCILMSALVRRHPSAWLLQLAWGCSSKCSAKQQADASAMRNKPAQPSNLKWCYPWC